ncbi:putative oxysterol-binding protein [Helianthus annuus]|uniref:Oxysterol-binding protein n=1 Tax=Helianthus annuus TaxID=4232 RepID=A0A251ULG3_HELAN|nr:putative oxysterol-binding protein [Helianthus annuus]KAJ0569054.1 putative oxysterol-binding protein [Helianthus annuus]KAJ0575409.1 putative oxysterol-binding protein [Helianthus annuus]KAJ0583334.1 putative oxysterol-binding protein [Helianthus annuus]KAJ0746067.1 putative oxysterol-binding protein [Helianthus annuus]
MTEMVVGAISGRVSGKEGNAAVTQRTRLRPYRRHLINGEYELANKEKLRLEQLQRQARSEV